MTPSISDYRAMFYQAYGYHTPISDRTILDIIDTVFWDEDVDEEDLRRVDAMLYAEDEAYV